MAKAGTTSKLNLRIELPESVDIAGNYESVAICQVGLCLLESSVLGRMGSQFRNNFRMLLDGSWGTSLKRVSKKGGGDDTGRGNRSAYRV